MSIDKRPSASRWKCVCAYDGAYFAGWQSQAGGRAIQDVIEAHLARIFKAPLRISGSGRTDAGVHAYGQVFHFDAAWRHGREKLRAALRERLPPTIQIKSIHPVGPTFHARFDAKGKIYVYHLYLGAADPFTAPYVWSILKPLDLPAMQAAVEILRGRKDFRAFSALTGHEKEDTIRELRRFELVRRGRRVRIIAEADGFMYKMMRSLVGALVSVGEGKITPGQLREILLSRKRIPVVRTAPPQGLFLMKVFY